MTNTNDDPNLSFLSFQNESADNSNSVATPETSTKAPADPVRPSAYSSGPEVTPATVNVSAVHPSTEKPLLEQTVSDMVDEVEDAAVSEEAATGVAELDVLEGETGPQFGPVEIIKHVGWGQTVAAGVFGLLISSVASLWLGVPGAFIPLVAWIGLCLGFFAPIDFKTLTIKNEHNLVFAAGTLILTVFAASQTTWSVLIFGIGATILVTIAMIAVVLFSPSGFKSGGDIKMSMVVAFGLGALNPLAPFIWMLASLLITGLGLLAFRKFKTSTAFAIATVLGVPIALLITHLLWAAIVPGVEVWGSILQAASTTV